MAYMICWKLRHRYPFKTIDNWKGDISVWANKYMMPYGYNLDGETE